MHLKAMRYNKLQLGLCFYPRKNRQLGSCRMHVRRGQLSTDTAEYVSDSTGGMSKRKNGSGLDTAHQKRPSPKCFYHNFKAVFAYKDVCVCVSHIIPNLLASIPTLIYIHTHIYTTHSSPSLIYIFL